MKWLALVLLVALQASCTTLVNHRDLYSPDPAPDSLEAARQWYGTNRVTTTTSKTTTITSEDDTSPPVLPQH